MTSKRYWQLIIAVALGSTYYFTLLPGPGYSGDTAKFQFVGHVLGTPHETGYPTYVLLNFVFTSLFPFGSLAFKANLLSAICSVAASLILFAVLTRLQMSSLVSIITSVTFGLGYTVWSQSLAAEVYALNLLFVSLVVYFFLRWHEERSTRLFLAGCLLYALSFGNHLTMVTFLPAIFYLVWKTDNSVFTDFRRIAAVLFIIVLGASQYAYVFLRTRDPTTQYLEMSASDWKSFWSAVSGGQFSHLLFGFSASWILFDRLPALLLFMSRELLFLLPFTIVGLTSLKSKSIQRFLLFAVGGNLIFCLGYAIYDIFIYLIPSYFLLAIFSARGLQAMIDFAKERVRFRRPEFLILIPAVVGLMNLGSVNQHHNTVANQHTVEALRTVGDNALLVCPDYHYAMIFLYHVLTGEWKGKNIHVVFYHDQRFPAVEISQYILAQRRFYIPVTRDSVPSGLKPYLFLDSFDVRTDQPFGITRRDEEASKQSSRNLFFLRKSEVEAQGLKLAETSDGLYTFEKTNME